MKLFVIIALLLPYCSFAQTGMAVFAEWQDSMKLVQFLKGNSFDQEKSILQTNPILASQGWDNLDYAAARLFELETVSEKIENGIVIRNCREIHTELEFFRIASGLPETTLKLVNQGLETIQMNSYISSVNCYLNDDFFTINLRFFDLLTTPKLISFAYAEVYNCGGMPWYESHAINLDLTTLQQLTNSDLLTSKALGMIGDNREGTTPWIILAENSIHSEESEDCPTDPKVYLEGNPELLIQRDGLRIINNLDGFGGANTICSNPKWAVIPYDRINCFLQPEIAELTNTLKP